MTETYFRLPTNAPEDATPEGYVDLIYSAASGQLAARTAQGVVSIGSGGGETTASILAKLAGATLSVDSVTLGPVTALQIQPAGSLALDPAGQLVVADGDRPGSVRVSDDRRFRGAVNMDFSPLTYLNLFNIILSQAECAEGATIRVIGTMRASAYGDGPSDVAAGFVTAAQFETDAGFPGFTTAGPNIFSLSTGPTVETDFDYIYTITDGAILTNQFASTEYLKSYYPGTPHGTVDGDTTFSLNADGMSIPHEAQTLGFYVQSYGGGTGLAKLAYDIQLIVTKP